MNNKLTNEEIARVFAMYPDCEIVNPNFTNTPLSYKHSMGRWFEASKYERQREDFWTDRKLSLTPLSAITDEHAVKLVEIINDEKISTKTKVIVEESIVKVYWSMVSHDGIIDYGYRYSATIYPDLFAVTKTYGSTLKIDYEAYQYLIQQLYAVPLFLGINHWANGKTAIDLEVAFDKTILK